MCTVQVSLPDQIYSRSVSHHSLTYKKPSLSSEGFFLTLPRFSTFHFLPRFPSSWGVDSLTLSVGGWPWPHLSSLGGWLGRRQGVTSPYPSSVEGVVKGGYPPDIGRLRYSTTTTPPGKKKKTDRGKEKEKKKKKKREKKTTRRTNETLTYVPRRYVSRPTSCFHIPPNIYRP